MKTKCLPFLVAALVSVLSIGAVAQITEATTKHVVTVPFFATDAHGKPATDLTPREFLIEDEGMPPAELKGFWQGASPLRLGVVIDASNSQRTSGVYRAASEALPAFLSRTLSDSENRVFIERFDTAVDAPTEWMNAEQAAHLRPDWQPRGASALFEAVERACKERMAVEASPTRRVLLLVTDGDDNQSSIKLDEAIASAQNTGTVIFVVSTVEEGNVYQRSNTGGTLKQLADGTGGLAFLHLRPKDLPKVFADIGQQLEGMYQVMYVLPASASAGRFRRVEVKAAPGKNLRVRAPKGYYVSFGQ